MKANTVKATVLLLALALLMAGCSFRNRSALIRKADRTSVRNTRLDALKKENAELRKTQKRNGVKIANLEKMLAGTRKEQQRFQRTMQTNFDMMEQSVTLTLSKRVTGEVAPGTPPKRLLKRATQKTRQVESRPDRKNSRLARPGLAQKSRPGLAQKSRPGLAQKSRPGLAQKSPAAMARRIPPPSGKDANPARRPVAEPPTEKRNTPPSLAEKRTAAPMRKIRVATKARARRAPPAARPSIAMDGDLSAPAAARKLSTHPPAKRLYEKGFALFAQKDFPQSILVFRNFLKRFPSDFYSDNAQFWIGEAHRYLNQPKKAEEAYRQVLRNYEHRSTLEGYKTPDAMYRLGQKFKKGGRLEKARQFFRTLAERFPDTSAGRRASTELSMLRMKTVANH